MKIYKRKNWDMIEPTMPVNPYERNPYSDIPELPPPPGMGKRKHKGVIIALVLLAIMLLGVVGVYVMHTSGWQQVSHAQGKQNQVTKTVTVPTQTAPAKIITGKEVLHYFILHGLFVVGAQQENASSWPIQPVDGAWGFGTAAGAGDYLQLAVFTNHQDSVEEQQRQETTAQDGPVQISVVGNCLLNYPLGASYAEIAPYMDVMREVC